MLKIDIFFGRIVPQISQDIYGAPFEKENCRLGARLFDDLVSQGGCRRFPDRP